jgi:hypothetical protein
MRITSTRVPSSRSSPDGVGHGKKQQPFDYTESLPAKFAVVDPVLYRHTEGITEYRCCFFETHAVLAPVGEVLGLIPLESQIFHFSL